MWLTGLTPTGSFALTQWSLAEKKSRPPVELRIHRCGSSLWKMFRQYHHLNGKRGASVRCYTAAYLGKPIAFMAVACVRMRTKYYRVSRLVVLPDYQGIGVGKRILNFIADLYSTQTKLPFCILTSNPQLIHGSLHSWKVVRLGNASMGRGNTKVNYPRLTPRALTKLG
jgi:GNAT superfamily N-acetyltransferase